MTYRRMVDVSHNNGAVDWHKLRVLGFQDAYIRACYGLHSDGRLEENWINSGIEQFSRGAYSYFLPSKNSAEQARNFHRLVKSIGFGEHPPAADIEYNAKPDGPENHPARFKDYKARVLAYVEEIEQLWGRVAAVYSSPNHIKTYLQIPELGTRKLWIANWKVNVPNVPPPWLPGEWYAWQVGQWDGKTYGASNAKIDVNVIQV